MAKDKSTEGEMELVSLESMAQGAPVEMFNDELAKCITNIMDQNTDAEKVRVITQSFIILHGGLLQGRETVNGSYRYRPEL